jgi:hypothetical protein
MESYSALITILIFSLLLVAAICYWLWRKGRVGRLVVIVFLSYISIDSYFAIYPSDSYYKSEFERITSIPFPDSGVVIAKESSYPDIHGDYESCALFSVSPEDYSQLKSKLLATLEAETGKTPYPCVDHEAWHNKLSNYLYSLTNQSEDESREWGLLKDNRVYFSFGSQ